MIFNQCIETCAFPSERKKGNVIPIHKKGDKETVESYTPEPLFHICVKLMFLDFQRFVK